MKEKEVLEDKKEEQKDDVSVSSSNESSVYNYGKNGDLDEDDDFMNDRQTDEDYSAYRERIFDWSPRKKEKVDEKKVLVEEINATEKENDTEEQNYKSNSNPIEIVTDANGNLEILPEDRIKQDSVAVFIENKIIEDEPHEIETQNFNVDVEITVIQQNNNPNTENKILIENKNNSCGIETQNTKDEEHGSPNVKLDEEITIIQQNPVSNPSKDVTETEILMENKNNDDTSCSTETQNTSEEEQKLPKSNIDWHKIREKYFSSDSSSENDDGDATDEPYYKILDVAEVTACTENPVGIKNKLIFKSIKKNLTEIKELMDWNFKPHSTENKIILKPWDDDDDNECDEDSDAFKLMESALKIHEKPEFEIKEPEMVISETDVIRYAKNIKDSINTVKQNESIKRVLKESKCVTVMQLQDNAVVPQIEEDKGEEPENTLMVMKGISQIRSRIAEFREDFDAFTSKYKQQYTALIENYNENCEKYDRNVRAILKKEMEEKVKDSKSKQYEKVKVEMTEEEFIQQMETMVGEGNLHLLKTVEDAENDDIMHLQEAHVAGQKFLEEERDRVRNITRSLEMQLAEEEQ